MRPTSVKELSASRRKRDELHAMVHGPSLFAQGNGTKCDVKSGDYTAKHNQGNKDHYAASSAASSEALDVKLE